MRVKHLQAYQAAKVGQNYVSSFTPDKYNIAWDGPLNCWRVECKETKRVVMISMYNVPWFEIENEGVADDTAGNSTVDRANEGVGSGVLRGKGRKG
jgi:hypothetical protein